MLAGGLGARFGGTKQLVPVGLAGETILEYNVYDALKAGFDSTVFLIRKEIERDFTTQVLARLPKHIRMQLAYQDLLSQVPASIETELTLWLQGRGGGGGDDAHRARSKPWGTGHALLCAMSAFGGIGNYRTTNHAMANGGTVNNGAPSTQGAIRASLPEPFAVVNADDLYGRQAFTVVRDFLASTKSAQSATNAKQQCSAYGRNRFCLATYPLDSVVPLQGSVSRALCTVAADGYLVKITEHVHIERKAERIVSVGQNGREEELDPGTPVSMNIWGLTTNVFARAKSLFSIFLSDRRNWDKGEFYLPAIIDSMLQDGSATVKALPVTETSFGLTNPEDLGATRTRLAALTQRGVYPSPLWAGFPKEER